jgi:hypothetical protein
MRKDFSLLVAAGALAWGISPDIALGQPSVLPQMPDDLGRFWEVIKHTKDHGGSRLISCGPSPAAPEGDQTCYLASGADLWLWLRNYQREVEKDPQFAGSLPIRLPDDIGDLAITYTPIKDGIRLPPAAFVSVENRDAFAQCWESGHCELAYALACEAGLTKKDDEHFAQPVMPFYYVRLYQNHRGEEVRVLYVNVWYAATRLPSPEGYARADQYFRRLLSMPPDEAARVPFDRPGTALVPKSVLDDFKFRQGQQG